MIDIVLLLKQLPKATSLMKPAFSELNDSLTNVHVCILTAVKNLCGNITEQVHVFLRTYIDDDID